MAAEIIPLVAPNGLPIVGMLLEDGSICPFEYIYDSASNVRYFKLLATSHAPVRQDSGESTLIDSKGGKWPATDVEFHSILKS